MYLSWQLALICLASCNYPIILHYCSPEYANNLPAVKPWWRNCELLKRVWTIFWTNSSLCKISVLRFYSNPLPKKIYIYIPSCWNIRCYPKNLSHSWSNLYTPKRFQINTIYSQHWVWISLLSVIKNLSSNLLYGTSTKFLKAHQKHRPSYIIGSNQARVIIQVATRSRSLSPASTIGNPLSVSLVDVQK